MAWFTVTLRANGGSGGAPSYLCAQYHTENSSRVIDYWATSQSTDESVRITKLRSLPTKAGQIFTGYTVTSKGSNQIIDADGVLLVGPTTITASSLDLYAQWVDGGRRFGEVVDYFGLASSALRPISSASGDNKQRVCVMNASWANNKQNKAGRFDNGVSEASGIWRNPTTAYEVVADCTVEATLGKAFGATRNGSTMTISGWMITGVKIDTQLGRFPVVTVTGTANEGADAINLFAVSVPVQARARPQNLLGAVSGGGNLQSLSLTAGCQPVVCAENMMPCASDVVGGRLTVAASTAAPAGESAPTAGGGFTAVGEPKSAGGKVYPTWSITAEKEIV